MLRLEHVSKMYPTGEVLKDINWEARLRRLSGSQTYALPKGVNISKYSAVYIHCKRYNHTYGRARFR